MEALYCAAVALPKPSSNRVASVESIVWSRSNKLACSVTVVTEELQGFDESRYTEHEVMVVDPDRPWITHSVFGSSLQVTHLQWSSSGQSLLCCDSANKLNVFETTSCINQWRCVHSSTLPSAPLCVSWYDPVAKGVLHPGGGSLEELVETQPKPYLLRKLSGKLLLSVTADCKLNLVWLEGSMDTERYDLIELTGVGISRLVVLDSGAVLCLTVSADQVLRLYRIMPTTHGATTVMLVAKWSASRRDSIQEVVMSAKTGVCEVHVLLDGNVLEKWVLKEMSTGYQPSLALHSNPFQDRVLSMAVASLPCSTMDGGGVSWSSELLVLRQQGEFVCCLRGDDYQLVGMTSSERSEELSCESAAKRPRSEAAWPLAVSPCGCCAAYTSDEGLLCLALCSPLAVVSIEAGSYDQLVRSLSALLVGCSMLDYSVWDLAVCTARMQKKTGILLVNLVLERLREMFHVQSPCAQRKTLQRYSTIRATLLSCLSGGMQSSLDASDEVRLCALIDFIACQLSPLDAGVSLQEGLERACEEMSSESSVEVVSKVVGSKPVVPQHAIQGITPAVNCISEYAVRVASRVVAQVQERIPERSTLDALRRSLVLLDLLQPAVPVPRLPSTDNLAALLFKVLTQYLQKPTARLTDVLPEVANIPAEPQSQEISHRKALYLQGFLHGLCEALLPDTYTELGCGIRPHVLSTQKVLDPFSPFLLELPPNLPPMWSASSPEGGRDVVQGNLIPAGQRTSLLQCSRCQGWSCAGVSQLKYGPHSTSSWAQLWLHHCPCGSPWVLREPLWRDGH